MNRCLKNLLIINNTTLILKDRHAQILTILNRYSTFSNAYSNNFQCFNEQKRYLARDKSKAKTNQHHQNQTYQHQRDKKDNKKQFADNRMKIKKPSSLEDLVKPLEVKPNPKLDEDIGTELCGELSKKDLNEVLITFRQNPQIMALACESGLNSRMFSEAILSFRKFCLKSQTLPPELHIKLYDVIRKSANETDLFPFFLQHSHELYPHLNCIDELKQISDLTEPAFWYVDARGIKRRIIYHAGPTNSGKTYSALQRFINSSSGIYCGPLKLLANEVYIKCNNAQTPCDLVTGEERKYAKSDCSHSDHLACTVEMANLDKEYEVAVIDEIQMINDPQRGWAWTRAFLGLKAKEIHVCGDRTASELLSDLSFLTSDTFELNEYERLTPLTIMDKALGSYDGVEPGDCFVCFSKYDIFNCVQQLEKRGHEVAVIYGSMPPGVKLAQAARFNDPNDKCKIMVATDAIGMGLNLNIRRIIFYSLRKPQMVESKLDKELITTSQALQIAGRAGRFNTAFKDGFVTTFSQSDLPVLKTILAQPLEKTKRAGLHPTADQIELFAYHLPKQPLSSLIEIFINICRIDSGQYFLCNFEDIKALAELIDHIPVKLKAKYTFATSPINRKEPFITASFVKFVRLYSNNEPVTIETLRKIIDWPFEVPQTNAQIKHLEMVYDVLDLYLWLGNRFPDIFCFADEVKQMRIDLEDLIFKGVKAMTKINMSLNETQPNTLNPSTQRHLLNRNLHRHTQNVFKKSEESAQIKNMFTLNSTSFSSTKTPETNSTNEEPIKSVTIFKKKENKTTQQSSIGKSSNEDRILGSIKLSNSGSTPPPPTTTTSFSNEKTEILTHVPNLKNHNEANVKNKYEKLVDLLKVNKIKKSK